jgi:hypothetical protein
MIDRCKFFMAIFFMWNSLLRVANFIFSMASPLWRVKQSLILLVFLLFAFSLSSQEQYFQQETNYKIRVSLNDEKHELSAFEEIQYINHSPSALEFIYFHIWPNAYKDHNTALTKQLLENGETKFYFSKPEQRGFIDSLDFKVNGETIKWEYDPEHIDICKLYLKQPLKSNDTILITTPFHVKIPDAQFSRLGHTDQAYYITQWYPKPAVLDMNGWHQMPYLNQGEFYSEYGSFDVSINLPQNYLLAATGDRLDADEEEKWLEGKVKETEILLSMNKLQAGESPFPASSTERKTVRFRQSKVHDFAWFADKRFHVLKDRVRLPNSNRMVDTWVYFTNNEAHLWKKSLEYVNDATLFYSYFLGDYPYNHVTAIDGVIAAGGGMEYPNITVIGESNNDFTLETTIMHEVGHNWFYGILGSNEREFPAMDEGLNSFYEMRYIHSKYPEKKLTALVGRDSSFKFFGLNKFSHKEYYKLAYLLAARKNTDQPIGERSEKFTNYNYGAIVYCKTAAVFDYLMNAVGAEKFDDAMRFYYESWKFKHPKPADLQKTLEYYCATDLKWFVEGLITSNEKLDYKVLKHRKLANGSHMILVRNNGNVMGPVSLSGYKDGRIVGQVWYNGFEGTRIFEFPPSEVDKFKIDGFRVMPEVNGQNNTIRTRGLFRKAEPIQFNFLGKIDDQDRSPVNYLPMLGYNSYNKFMLGCAFYNYSVYQKRFEWTLAPMYAFGSNTPVGFADFQFNLTPKKAFQEISFGSKFKSFAYDFSDKENLFPGSTITDPSYFAFSYYKIDPFLNFEIKKKNPRSSIDQFISLRSANILYEKDLTYSTVFTAIQMAPYKKLSNYYVNEIAYSLRDNRAINPYGIKLSFQQNEDFGKVSLTANYEFTTKNKSALEFRLFAGSFVYGNNKGPYRFRASGLSGYQDYMYDYNFIGRNEYSGSGFAQFADEDGALKTWTPLGQSDTWMLALNIKSPKFFKLPLKIFADVVTCDPSSLNNEQVLYDVGIDLCIWKDIIEIYVPLAYNKDIKDTFILNNKNSFFETIRFTLNINKIKPRELLTSSLP